MEHLTKAALAGRIRSERRDKGWTLERFAEASGVSRAMISKIERGDVADVMSKNYRALQALHLALSAEPEARAA
jgi:transcriptional regulator with XRE-family HTH domain